MVTLWPVVVMWCQSQSLVKTDILYVLSAGYVDWILQCVAQPYLQPLGEMRRQGCSIDLGGSQSLSVMMNGGPNTHHPTTSGYSKLKIKEQGNLYCLVPAPSHEVATGGRIDPSTAFHWSVVDANLRRLSRCKIKSTCYLICSRRKYFWTILIIVIRLAGREIRQWWCTLCQQMSRTGASWAYIAFPRVCPEGPTSYIRTWGCKDQRQSRQSCESRGFPLVPRSHHSRVIIGIQKTGYRLVIRKHKLTLLSQLPTAR